MTQATGVSCGSPQRPFVWRPQRLTSRWAAFLYSRFSKQHLTIAGGGAMPFSINAFNHVIIHLSYLITCIEKYLGYQGPPPRASLMASPETISS